MKKIIFILGLILINLNLSSQISLFNTSTPATVNTCDSGLFEFNIVLGTPANFTDSVTFIITLPQGVEFAGVFSSSVGTVYIRSIVNDTANITINGFPPSTTSFNFEYYTKSGCNSFQTSTQNVSNQVLATYLSNTDTLISSYIINSAFLNFTGTFTPSHADPFIPYSRRFVYHNTGIVPFIGDISFLDTLVNNVNNTGVRFDTAQITNPAGVTIINSQITDTSVYFHAHVSNLLPGDSIVFEETLVLFNCNFPISANYSDMIFFYGCTGESSLSLCTPSPNIAVQTTIAPNLSTPLLAMDMLDPNQLLGDIKYSCPNSDDLRIIRIINNGGGTDSLMFNLFKGGNHVGEIGYFDTSEVKVFHYVGSTIQYLPIVDHQLNNYTFINFTYDLSTSSTPDQYIFKVACELDSLDSIFVEYRDKNFCIGPPSFPRVYNQTIISHSLRFFASAKIGCNNTWTSPSDMEHATSREPGYGIMAQKFSQTQFFQNFNPYLNNLQEAWYDVINLTPLQMNGNHSSFTHEIFLDPAKCQLVYELDIDSGITLIPDSLYLLSQQSSGNVVLLPDTIIDLASGGTGGLVKAIFSFPSSFFDPNPGQHNNWGSHWIKSNIYDQFFSNSSLHFRLKAHCPFMPYDSRAEIKERALFVYDNTCGSGCEFPLAEKESVINLLCPGCKIPGWNVSQIGVQRINFGFTDTDNNNRPDQAIPVLANASTSEEDRVTYGDTIEFHMKSFVSDGDSILFSNIGFPFKYGWLEFKGPMVPNIQYIGGSGTWRGFNISLDPSLSYSNQDSILIDISPSSLQPFVMNLLDTMYRAGDTMDITMQFVVSSNLVFSSNYITMQQINCKQYMSGIERTDPAMVAYAGPDAQIIAPLAPAQRKNYYYWCTGNGGSLLAFGNDFGMYSHGSSYGQYYYGGPTVQDYCYKQLQANLGNKSGQQHVFLNSLDVTNQFALNSFQYEIRDFMQIDSISFTYPSTSYFVDSIYIYQYNLRSDIQTYNTNYTNSVLGNNYFVYPVNLARFSGNTVVIYPKALTQYLPTAGHPFFEADTLSRGDESKVLVPTLFLKMIDYCATPEQLNVSSNQVTAWLSNMPVQGGNVILTDTIHGDGAYFSDDFIKPSPDFTLSGSPSPLITSSNPITWNFSMQVNNELTTSTLSSHEAIVKSFAPNNFIGAYSPSGNITVTGIVPVTVPSYTTSAFAPISISPLPVAYKLGNLDPSSGLLTFLVNATFNCANINGIDSLYVITGYNCYEYPTSLSDVCYLDTTVLYLQPQLPGVQGIVISPDSVAACDTMDIEIDLTVSGQGNISQFLVNLNLPSSTQYIPGSGELSFTDNSSTININSFDPLSGQWDLTSVSQLTAGVNQTNNPIVLKFKVKTLCDYNLDSIILDVSATNYCQQPISFSLHATPSVLLPAINAVQDSFIVSSFNCDPLQLSYHFTFPVASQFPNSVLLQVPYPFVFSSNMSDTLTIHHSVGSTGSHNVTIPITSITGTYPCGSSVIFDLFVLQTQELQCSPADSICTNSNVITNHLTCSFNFDIPVASITASACSAGCTPLTGQVTGGNAPFQYLWTNLTTSTNISTTINANACPTSANEDFQFQVTDVYGCIDTATINVESCCTTLTITCYDTIIPYNQELCSSSFIPDTPLVNSGCPVISLESDWPGGPFPWGVTTVTWTAINQFGDTATCQQLVTYNPTTLFMSYTILAGRSVSLSRNNDVLSGAVGVHNITGSATFDTLCSVNGPGHFVKSPNITTIPIANPNIPVAYRFYSQATVTAPPFFTNTFSGPTTNLSGTVTLPAGNYGIINIAANSNVTVTGNITAYRIMVNGTNATITFNQTTSVIVSERMHCANFTSFNPTQEDVKVYVGGSSSSATDVPTIKIGPRCDIYGFLFTPNGRFHVEAGIATDRTNMTGQFIGKYVTSEKQVEWNSAFDCSPYMLTTTANVPSQDTVGNFKINPSAESIFSIVPNPASFDIEVKFSVPYDGEAKLYLYDGNGKQLGIIFNGQCISNEMIRIDHNVSALASGIYHLVLQTDKEVLSRKLIVVPE